MSASWSNSCHLVAIVGFTCTRGIGRPSPEACAGLKNGSDDRQPVAHTNTSDGIESPFLRYMQWSPRVAMSSR